VARYLGGSTGKHSRKSLRPDDETKALFDDEQDSQTAVYRPVTIIDASAPKKLDLCIEVPLDDMKRLDEIELIPSGPAAKARSVPLSGRRFTQSCSKPSKAINRRCSL
jgi:ATP-dependent Lhr-like helicase